MIHDGFKWDEASWSYEYQTHFERFKQAFLKSIALFFPDYSLDWVLRTDASQGAVGGVLYQQTLGSDGAMKPRFSASLGEIVSHSSEVGHLQEGVLWDRQFSQEMRVVPQRQTVCR